MHGTSTIRTRTRSAPRWWATIPVSLQTVAIALPVAPALPLPDQWIRLLELLPPTALIVPGTAPLIALALLPGTAGFIVAAVQIAAILAVTSLAGSGTTGSIWDPPILLGAFGITLAASVVSGVTLLRARRLATALLAKSYEDPVSRLPNRYRLLDDLAGAHEPALALAKAERFAEINAMFGSEFGERYMVSIQRVIELTLNETLTHITLYHVDRDTFAILQQYASRSDRESLRSRFESVVRLLREQTFTIGGHRFPVPVTIGISADAVADPLLLYNQAEQALTAALYARRRTMFHADAETVRRSILSNTEGLALVSQALRGDGITVFFQPIMRNRGSKIELFEALVRIRDEGGRLVQPAAFLSATRLTSYFAALTRAVFEQAFKRMAGAEGPFTVNISLENVTDDDFLPFLADLMRRYARCRDRCVLEITESEETENFAAVRAFIDEARELGYRIAIDDFGSGYSNFANILELRVDFIKFDGSIVQRIVVDPQAFAVLGKMNEIAHTLGVKTIAEYVDSKELLAAVRRLKIDYSQGYLVGKPAAKLVKQAATLKNP